jgi:PAS domain S-box-containing protein
MPHTSIGLGPKEFAAAFPFHFIVGPDLVVRQAGPSLHKLLPALANGGRIDELLRLFRPEGEITFDRLAASARDLLVFAVPSIGALLRGSIISVDGPSPHLLFLGSPWIVSVDDLARLKLAVHDFALHDATPDLLHYHQAQQVTLSELRDVSDALRRKTDDLKSREDRTRAILNSMMDGLVVLDDRGQVVECNGASMRLFGMAECRHGAQFADVLAPESAAAFRAVPLDGWAGKAVEWQGRRQGQSFPLEVRFFEVPDAAGVRLAAHLRDLSEAREMARLKREFIATVSHELRTPLTSVMGSLKLLSALSKQSADSDTASLVSMAERNAARLRDLVNEILDLERMGTGRMEMTLAPTPVSTILQHAGEAVGPMARQEQITVNYPATALSVVGDEERLARVVINLVSNAVKFSPRGSVVSVTAATVAPDVVEIAVNDRGPGVPDAFQTVIFEPFRQVEGADNRQKNGSGLGLAIAQSIITQHGGTIGYRPREGGGATFWFTLPAA